MQDIMDVADIAFPHLGIYLRNVPRSFSIFGFSIAFYGVIIGLGIFCGILLAAHIAKKEQLNPDLIWDFAIYAIIFSIIGARIYYVIFRWDLYQDDLLSIFNTRKGGLAIYGAVIAAFITLWIYCKVKKLSFLQIADIEKVHGDRFGRYAQLIREGKHFVSDVEEEWMCLNCGYVFKGTKVPERCPVCQHDKGYFIRFELSPYSGH